MNVMRSCKQPEYSARGMMRRYHVEVVCTTDDPIDSLEYHIKTRESGFEIKMLAYLASG